MKLNQIIILFFVLSFFPRLSFSQEIKAPVKIQSALLLKILDFDRNLNKEGGDEIIIGIFYQGKLKESQKIKDDFKNEILFYSKKSDKYRNIEFVAIDIEKLDLQPIARKYNIDLIYITQLDPHQVKSIINFAQKNKIWTVSGELDYVEFGIAVGFGLNENKPQIIINLAESKAQGANFSSKLLKLAKIIE